MKSVALMMIWFPCLLLLHLKSAFASEDPSCVNIQEESLASLLQTKFASNPSVLVQIRQKLRQGKLVIIRDALPLELAEQVHQDLDSIPAEKWPLNSDCLTNGFCYSHHNFYDWRMFSETMNRTLALFDHPRTKDLISDLSGRNCWGNNSYGAAKNPTGTASWYMPGDFSLPHTDHIGQRTVAYVWHLSKNWRPEWGGALYWAGTNDEHAYQHASFNSLVLFSVTSRSSHFVTTVSQQAQEKRMSFNGWWTSAWYAQDVDQVEARLRSNENDLADREFFLVRQFLAENKDLVDADRHQALADRYEEVVRQAYPPNTDVGIY